MQVAQQRRERGTGKSPPGSFANTISIGMIKAISLHSTFFSRKKNGVPSFALHQPYINSWDFEADKYTGPGLGSRKLGEPIVG
jgi:hypothetical protein